MSWWTAKKYKIALLGIGFVLAPRLCFGLNYQNLMPGMDYAVAQIPQQAKVHLLKIDLDQFEVKPITASTWQSRALSALQMQEKSKALAVINANFFNPQGQALGLILRDGKIEQAPQKNTWGASWLSGKNKMAILKSLSTEQILAYEQGVQAGPRLVVSGRAMTLKKEFSPKSAVGWSKKNEVVLIASEGFVEINALGQWLATPEKQGGAGLREALNLDGGSSTQFYFKAGGVEVSIPGLALVPVGLGVFQRTAMPRQKASSLDQSKPSR